MEQLIFFLVLIFFSIIESVARRRKQNEGEGPIDSTSADPGGADRDEYARAQRARVDLPTYDEEPSYDDLATAGGTVPSSTPDGSAPDQPSSRTMLPGGLLEQLAGIAAKVEAERQRMERAEVDVPVEDDATHSADEERVRQQRRWVESQARREARAREREDRSRAKSAERARTPTYQRRGPARPVASHRVHRAHAEYGTDPSERSRSEQDGLDPLATTLSADAKAIRGQLLSNSASALRQAIILQEVLGPPKAMREEQA